MKLPPLRALQCFEAVARLNSFSKAAEHLSVTQSAVSHQVRLLEDYLGETLFNRQGLVRKSIKCQSNDTSREIRQSSFGFI